MKKSMIKNLLKQLASAVISRPWTAVRARVQQKVSPPLKVRITRKNLMLILPARLGGQFHILPNPVSSGTPINFDITSVDDGRFALRMMPSGSLLASYPTQAEAFLALAALAKALTLNPLWKWGFRLFLAWLAWLFLTSYIEVRQQMANGPGAVVNTANIPAEAAPFQAAPSAAELTGGDLSEYIYSQAMAAKEKAQREAQPIKAGQENAAGLTAFGLKGVDGKNAVEGCDPNLAFKVPTQK